MAGANTSYLTDADAPAFALNYGELVKLSKALIESKFGTAKPELLAEDFEFRFPVVELNKARFVEAFASFKLDEAFPDMTNAYYGFRLDPFVPGRIWFDTQGKGTHTGKFGGPFSYVSPTQKEVVLPPQALSFTFTEEGLLKSFTGGYVIDRRMGSTGGLGGVFGIMHAIGYTLPFPEAQPFSLSTRYRVLMSLDEAARKVYSLSAGYSELPKKIYDASLNTKESVLQSASSYYTSTKDSIVQTASGYYTTALQAASGETLVNTTTEMCSSAKDKVVEATTSCKEKAVVSFSFAKDRVVVAISVAQEKALEAVSGVKGKALEVVSDARAKVVDSATGVYTNTKEKVVERTAGVYASASHLSSSMYSNKLETAQQMYSSVLQSIKHFFPTMSGGGTAASQ
mmetsp:Transcript_30579/g.66715  ORF Transcript_30579/g.66715 Transcript_30579/m.66715 type:complete len:399 (-) Transcript_30579:159-1355(-)